MPIADELIAILGYKIEGKEKLKDFQKGVDDTEKKVGMSVKRIGAAGAAAATAAIAVTSAAVSNFANFERQMTRIGITAGASIEETQKAAEDIQRMARDFAMPVDDAVKGLDTLTASGKNMKEAMEFLPSVLATAQAAGASTADVANTAIKASEALKIQAKDMQRAFDIMVAGGKAGQFELKDMAQYIPELANSFASLGYKGEPGLQKLIALMQTIREDTGSASGAATQLQNVFGKIYAEQTSKAFAGFGIDLEKALKKATAAGEDTVAASVRLSNLAIKGDLTKLPKLFTDQEFRLGMQSLMTSADSYKNFIAAVNGSQVDGQVMADLNRVLTDTEAKIQRMSNSWDRFMKSLGSAASNPVGGVLDAMSDELDYGEAVRKGLEKRGMQGFWEKENWLLKNTFDKDAKDAAAREGGYVPKAGYNPMADSRLTDADLARKRAEADRDRVQGEITQAQATRNAVAASPSPKAAALTASVDQRIAALQAQLQAMNANLANMTGETIGPVNATVTDARQDNRQFPVTVSAPVTVNVQQAAQAPAAVGGAVSNAVKSGVAAQPARMQSGPME